MGEKTRKRKIRLRPSVLASLPQSLVSTTQVQAQYSATSLAHSSLSLFLPASDFNNLY